MSKFKSVMLALAIVALMAPAAGAATFGAEVFGAFNTYNMQDANDAIDALNAAGSNYDQLGNGLTGGLGLRMWPNANWMLQACWEPLFLTTESKIDNGTQKLDANSFQLSAYYFAPSANPKAKYGFGGGVGMYSINGEYSMTTPLPASGKIEGSGPGFHVMGLGEWTMSPSFDLTAGAGYRIANVDVKDSPTNATADYSGFIARAGVAFHFPQGQ